MGDAEDEDLDRKKVFFLGRDIATIPCFRDSLVYGISGGFASGILWFLRSSNIRRATDVTVWGFMLITLGYWFPCRYNYSKINFELAQVQAHMQMKVASEGTDYQEEVEKLIIVDGADTKTV